MPLKKSLHQFELKFTTEDFKQDNLDRFKAALEAMPCIFNLNFPRFVVHTFYKKCSKYDIKFLITRKSTTYKSSKIWPLCVEILALKLPT